MAIVREVLWIEGIVQGVGFRPFVYKLAHQNTLNGYILNNSAGVEIDLEGELESISNFLLQLKNQLPPLARVDKITKTKKDLYGYSTFEIQNSHDIGKKQTLVSPDISMCDDCLIEFFDNNNFRSKYFFINCTNCGPRYSIIESVPYDRVNTSMKNFCMCDFCKSEYENPNNRRYHAQPISCKKCGPQLFLYQKDLTLLAKNIEAIEFLATYIKAKNIVILKGLGGFHIITRADSDECVSNLREKKHRPTKPFAVMFKDLKMIQEYTYLSEEEIKVITSKERPIVIVKTKKDIKLSKLLAPNTDRLGVFLPYTPLHQLLFEYIDFPIIATSANRSNEPIINTLDEAIKKLSNVADYFLDYNREILNSSDDSVVQVIGKDLLLMRSSRGFAPSSLRVESICDKKILAVGAHQKNQIALYFDNQLILSPFIGDLESIENIELFEKTIHNFCKFYNFVPDLIVCDKHPRYISTKWAEKQNIRLLKVQHHYAHILSVLLEKDLKTDVLGISFDGTGYGDDRTIWGGEFFICNQNGYKRAYTFEPFKLLGGESAIKDIKKVGLSLLLDLYSLAELKKRDNALTGLFLDKELLLLDLAHKKGLNTPFCSSVGRLFDAVASIANMCQKASYDGESGLIIETLYDKNCEDFYDFEIINGTIYYKNMFKEILNEQNKSVIASKFINTLAEIISQISSLENLPVILSGGVFQNRTLLELTMKKLNKKGIICHMPNKIPINDSGIAFGQIAYAINNYKNI